MPRARLWLALPALVLRLLLLVLLLLPVIAALLRVRGSGVGLTGVGHDWISLKVAMDALNEQQRPCRRHGSARGARVARHARHTTQPITEEDPP
jgi:hypothetical protein